MKKRFSLAEEIAPDFHLGDLMQVIIGATILAIPVGYTVEVWSLSETLPLYNLISMVILSLLFLGVFTYYHYHHKLSVEKHWNIFFKRTLFTYIITFAVVFVMLALIQKISLTHLWVGIKRTIIVSLPASMSATIADTINTKY